MTYIISKCLKSITLSRFFAELLFRTECRLSFKREQLELKEQLTVEQLLEIVERTALILSIQSWKGVGSDLSKGDVSKMGFLTHRTVFENWAICQITICQKFLGTI